jgi:hypothetical protein
MMERFGKNPEKPKDQSQGKENSPRKFYPGGSYSPSQENVQQDLSSANKDAENHHLHGALGYEEFVGKVKSEIEHLNKIIENQELNKQYNKIMTSQKLKEMQNLSNFYSNISNTLEKLIESGPEEMKFIDVKEKYIADIGKQIDLLRADNNAHESKPFSHWLEESKRFLETENSESNPQQLLKRLSQYAWSRFFHQEGSTLQRMAVSEYQREVDFADKWEARINYVIEQRNVVAELLQKERKVRQSYEKNIDKADIFLVNCKIAEIKMRESEKTYFDSMHDYYQIRYLSELVDNKLSRLVHEKYLTLVQKTLEEVPLPEKRENEVKLIKDVDSLTAYLRSKRQEINEIKYNKDFQFGNHLDEIEEYCNESVKLAQGEDNCGDVKKLHGLLIQNFDTLKEFMNSLKKLEKRNESLQKEILQKKLDLHKIKSWLNSSDIYCTDVIRRLIAWNYHLKNNLLSDLIKVKEDNEEKLQDYKEKNKEIYNLYKNVNKTRDKVINKVTILEELIKQKQCQDDDFELVAQMPDDPKQKPIARLRRTSSENALAQRWQGEKLQQDFLSKTREQRQSREGWWNSLKEQKVSLENRENALKYQIDLCLEKNIKEYQILQVFKGEVQKLLQKFQEQLEQKSREQIEPEALGQMAIQAVKKIVETAWKKTDKEPAKPDSLLSAAVTRIAGKVKDFLNQQGVDQRAQGSANQPEKRELKQAIESKLQLFLADLERALPLLDYARLKNNSAQYSKELEGDLEAIPAQMKEIENKLHANKEQLEKMKEEEKEIYGGPILDTARSKMYEELKKDRDVSFESLVNAIKSKCNTEERICDTKNMASSGKDKSEDTYEKFITTINNLARVKLSEDDRKAIKDVYQAYKRTKEADSEVVQASNTYKLALRAGDSEEQKKALQQICEKAVEKKALADEQLVQAERKVKVLYEPLAKAFQHERKRFEPIVKGLEETKKANEKKIKENNTRNLRIDDIFDIKNSSEDFRHAKWRKHDLSEYGSEVSKVNYNFMKYDEMVKKNIKANEIYKDMQKIANEREQICNDKEAIQERLRLAEERLAEIKNYQDLKKELEQVQKQKDFISKAIDKASQELSEAKLQEKGAKELNSLFKELAEARVALYPEPFSMKKHILERQEELKDKEKEISLAEDSFNTVNNEIIQIENKLKMAKSGSRRYKEDMRSLKDQRNIIEEKQLKVKNDELIQFKGEGDEKINELVSLQESIKEQERDMEGYTSVIAKTIEERNALAKILGQNVKTMQEYKQGLQFDPLDHEEDPKNRYFSLKNSLKEIIREIDEYVEEEKLYRSTDYTQQIEKSINDYNNLIKRGLIIQSRAEFLYEQSYKKEYSEKKTRFLSELTNDINRQKAKENDLQSKLHQINDEIASEEKKLSPKLKKRQSLQKKLDTIHHEAEQLAKEIKEIKEKEEKLEDKIKDQKLSEARTMRLLKEKIADLTREKSMQLYGLILADTKVPKSFPSTS